MPKRKQTDFPKALAILNDRRWASFVAPFSSPKDKLELSDEDVDWCWEHDDFMESFCKLPAKTLLECMGTMSVSQKETMVDTIRFCSCLTNVESDTAWDGMMDELEDRCSTLLSAVFKALGDDTAIKIVRKLYREALRNAMKAKGKR